MINLFAMPSGPEVLLICLLIGGISGYFFRDKKAKRGTIIAIVLGGFGAIITSAILVTFVYGHIIAMPIYALLGSYLFNAIRVLITGK